MRCLTAKSLLVALIALIAGCGGGSSSSSSRTTASATSTTTVVRHASVTAPPRARSVPPATAAASPPAQTAVNARVPASFHLMAGGRLQPPTVSAPAFLAVALSVASADSRPHTIQVRGHRLKLAPHGRASLRLAGLRAGTYPILVDGRPRGSLLIGGEPGP